MIRFNELFDFNKKTHIVHEEPIRDPVQSLPWIDKYRPKKLDEIVYQNDIIKIFKTIVETGNLPHLLLHGPPGSGKTSSILAVAIELFGPKIIRDRVIELNASDERGINIVRNKIVTFAKLAIGNPDPNYPSPPYKIIILDEADAMTNEAQSALRKIMEDRSSITRFCFICNYENQIIDPITSRCVKLRFKALDDASIVEKLKVIATEEHLSIDDNAFNAISTISNGDMRRSIMLLQNLKYIDKNITIDDVYELSNMVREETIDEIMKTCISKINDNSTKEILNLSNDIYKSGYPLNILLCQLTKEIIKTKLLTDKMKSEICYHISITEKRLIDGADEYLQIMSVLMNIKYVSFKDTKIDLLK